MMKEQKNKGAIENLTYAFERLSESMRPIIRAIEARDKTLKRLLKEVRVERYKAMKAVFVPRKESPGVVDVDLDVWDHLDRLFEPREDRLKNMIGQE